MLVNMFTPAYDRTVEFQTALRVRRALETQTLATANGR
jgi:hypothetical protein